MKISKIWIIIKSRLKSKKNMPKWYYDRLEICEKCKFNSKNQKELSFKQKVLYFLNSLKPFCTICFCNLQAKSSIAYPEEDCGMVNLGEESKWKNIKTE